MVADGEPLDGAAQRDDLVVILAGASVLTQVGADSSNGIVTLAMVLLGVGMGFNFITTALAAQNAVDHGYVGVAAALINFTRNIGAAVAGAVLGAILTAGGQADEIRRLLAAHASAGAVSSAQLADTYTLMFAAVSVSVAIAAVFLSMLEYRTFRATID